MPLDAAFWANEQQMLYSIAYKAVAAAGTDGAQAGMDELIAQYGLGLDWGAISADVQQWARQHAGELVKGITQTSRTKLQQAIDDWIQSGQPLTDLIDSIEPMFGETRAAMIASTEVTRAFHEGNMVSWKSAGVVGKWRFNTAMDELVCPECGPMQGKTFPLDDQTNAPPLHPRCRCWSQPVVEKP